MTRLYAIEAVRVPTTGDVSGFLMSDDGEILHSHMSSDSLWLLEDLTVNFGRRDALADRFGEFELIYIGMEDDMPEEAARLLEEKKQQ